MPGIGLRAFRFGDESVNGPSSTTGNIKLVTTNYTILPTDGTIISSGNNTITLPDAAALEGRILTFKGTVLLSPVESQLIDSLPNFTSNTSVTIQSDGSNWVIISDYTVNTNLQINIFNQNGTYNLPEWAKLVYVFCIAGGGAGGGGAPEAGIQILKGGGGGGASGEVAEHTFSALQLTPTVDVTVGMGGRGGTTGSAGAAGGDSSFGSYLIAKGGAGGAAGAIIEDSGSEGASSPVGTTGGYGSGPIGLGTKGSFPSCGGGGGGVTSDSLTLDATAGADGPGGVLGGAADNAGADSTSNLGGGGGGGSINQYGSPGGLYGAGGGGAGGDTYTPAVTNLRSTARIINPGSGYTAPVVTVEAPKISGSGPVWHATFSLGLITSIYSDTISGKYDGTELITITDPTGISCIADLLLTTLGGAGAPGVVVIATI